MSESEKGEKAKGDCAALINSNRKILTEEDQREEEEKGKEKVKKSKK